MKRWLALPFLFICFWAMAQDTLPLNDLSFWKSTGAKNWQIAGDVTADPEKDDEMTAGKGAGILVNLPDAKNRANLLSVAEYGDVDVSFDFMMARHSNSGFYLQGRYEVQLLDSWGHLNPTFGDCAGVYARRRWNPAEELFDGHAPRLNACLAPGLWQHLEISFQAPRFDAGGQKIANARLLKVVLNGVVVHEQVELTGPTGGPISEQEATKGPFMIQGDHGPVAFRNFKIVDKGGAAVQAGPFNFKVIDGNFRYPNEFAGKTPVQSGASPKLTWEAAGKDNSFALLISAPLQCPQAGKHLITLQAAGKSILKVDGQELLADQWTWGGDQRVAEINLSAGKHSLELTYYKMDGWMAPVLGLWIENPGSRAVAFHTLGSSMSMEAADPIGLDAATPKVFRSFMDIFLPHTVRGEKNLLNYKESNKKRVVHAVQVGHPDRLNYTYDLDNGAVAQMWKGGFLNTSPMWDNRGDGSSQPIGAVLPFDDIQTIVPKNKLFDLSPSQNDPAPGFKPLGYDLDENGQPGFRYQYDHMEVQDLLRVKDGKMLHRTVSITQLPKNSDYVLRIAVGNTIEKIKNGLWAIDGKRYYIQTPDGLKPLVESSGRISVLYVPAAENQDWSIWW